MAMTLGDDRSASRSLTGPSAYGLMMTAAVAAFLFIDQTGTGIWAAEGPNIAEAAPNDAPGASHLFAHVLLTLIAVVALGQALGRLLRVFGQPPVIGEILAGIILGPSLLGRAWPEASAFLMPAEVGPFINVVAQLGVILYMFLVGLELNPAVLREGAGRTLAISHASMAAPFVAGAGLGLFFYPELAAKDASFTSFALFMGVAMSVTAFPVLARILTDRGMQTTPLGVTALGAAAAGDVTAWCLLAFVVGISRAAVGDAVWTLSMTVVFCAVMLIIVRPILGRWLRRYDEQPLTPAAMAVVFVAVLASAATTEAIGVHALFGAFLLGAVIPHDSKLAHAFGHKLEDVVTVLLLPAFFASVGMRTQIGLISGFENWLICGLIILVATASKFGGTYAAARLAGIDSRNAAGLGALMNTRGLMELIVLNIGLELNVISPTLFAMMVVMALVTTAMTGPWLRTLGIARDSGTARTRREAIDGIPIHCRTMNR